MFRIPFRKNLLAFCINYVPVVLLLTISTVLCLFFLYQGHNWGDDFCLYLNQAKSITDNSIDIVKSRNEFSIENSSFHTFSPVLAPWGFPVLLSTCFYLFGLNIPIYKFFMILFFILYLYSYFILIKRNFTPTTALLSVALLGINTNYILHTNNILSEFPYLFFANISLFLIGNYKAYSSGIVRAILLGIVIFFSFWIRSEGSVLCLSLLAWQLKEYLSLKCKFSWAIAKWFALPFIIVLALYIIMSLVLPNGFVSHLNDRSLVDLKSIITNLNFYHEKFREFIYPDLPAPAYLLIEFLFSIGLLTCFKRDIHIAVYTIFLIITYLLWPFKETRYLFIFSPFLIYFVIRGIDQIIAVITTKVPGSNIVLPILICLNILTLYPAIQLRQLQEGVMEGPDTEPAREMFSFVKTKTEETDTIVFFRARAMTLYGQRKSVMIFWNNWNELMKKGNYLVIHKQMEDYCQMSPKNPFFRSQAFQKVFTKVFENEKFIIYGKFQL